MFDAIQLELWSSLHWASISLQRSLAIRYGFAQLLTHFPACLDVHQLQLIDVLASW